VGNGPASSCAFKVILSQIRLISILLKTNLRHGDVKSAASRREADSPGDTGPRARVPVTHRTAARVPVTDQTAA